MQPEHGEEITRHIGDDQTVGMPLVAESRQVEVVKGHVRENIRLLAIVHVIQVGELAGIGVHPVLHRDHGQPVSILYRQRPEHEHVAEAEDRRVSPNAQRQR